MVSSKADVCLLLSVRPAFLPQCRSDQKPRCDLPDERVHLCGLHIVELLHRILNLPLVRPNVDNKHQRVVLLNLFHRRFRVQRSAIHAVSISISLPRLHARDDSPELVHSGRVLNGFPRVLGVTTLSQRLWPAERHRVAGLAA